jgi:hypothetical protein
LAPPHYITIATTLVMLRRDGLPADLTQRSNDFPKARREQRRAFVFASPLSDWKQWNLTSQNSMV